MREGERENEVDIIVVSILSKRKMRLLLRESVCVCEKVQDSSYMIFLIVYS